MWDVIAVVIGLLALGVASAAFRQDRTTALSTKQLAAETNDVQGRLLAIEEARRLDEMAPDFELAYDQDNPDPKRPGWAWLLLTYNGQYECERLVVEEIRDLRWSSVVVMIERHAAHTDAGGNTRDILTHLQPGETRPFAVKQDLHGRPGEIRLRLTATVDGHEYAPIVESCFVEPPREPGVRWLK